MHFETKGKDEEGSFENKGGLREEESWVETESRKDEFGQETLTCGSLEIRDRVMLDTPDTSRPTRAGSTN
jgi:hypothetical protein